MTAYAALLRGINVGTAKRIAMADLRAIVEACGGRAPHTLLNSGNVVFTATGPPADLARRIEAGIVAHAGFHSRVFLIPREALDAVVAENPLLARMDHPSRLQVAFVDAPEVLEGLAPLQRQDWGDEALGVGSRAAYLWCPHGMSRGAIVEAAGRVLGSHTTMRAWSTVSKLHAMVQAVDRG